MSDTRPTLAEAEAALKTVLNEFGPQQLTDGLHGHLTWLLDLVESCTADDNR